MSSQTSPQPPEQPFKSPLGDFKVEIDVTPPAIEPRPPSTPYTDNPLRRGMDATPYDPGVSARNEEFLRQLPRATQTPDATPISRVGGTLARRTVSQTLGRIGLRGLGIATIPLQLADLMEIAAPGVHRWLRGGWRGASGYSIPLVPGAIVSQVGRSSAFYIVSWRARYWVSATQQSNEISSTTTPVQGPISIAAYPRDGVLSQSDVNNSLSVRGGNGAQVTGFSAPNGIVAGSLFISISYHSGVATNEGPVRRPGALPVHVANPRPQDNQYTPFRDLGVPASRRIGGTVPTVLTPVPRELPAPSDPTLPSPTYSPESTTKPDTLTKPQEKVYPVPPKNPPKTLAEEEFCDPCDLLIGAKIDELARKIDELDEKMEPPAPPDCPSYPLSFIVVSCMDDGPILETRTIFVTEPVSPYIQEDMERTASLAVKGCGAEPIAAVPDYWQARISVARPQVVITYRKGTTLTYHTICLPHPITTAKWTENFLGNYEKGPYSGMLTLNDNSKFIINCSSETEANRMLAIAKSLIQPAFLTGNYHERVTLRKGETVGSGAMFARKVSYFPEGQKQLMPAWTLKL